MMTLMFVGTWDVDGLQCERERLEDGDEKRGDIGRGRADPGSADDALDDLVLILVPCDGASANIEVRKAGLGTDVHQS
jgi:hypothetical protein